MENFNNFVDSTGFNKPVQTCYKPVLLLAFWLRKFTGFLPGLYKAFYWLLPTRNISAGLAGLHEETTSDRASFIWAVLHIFFMTFTHVFTFCPWNSLMFSHFVNRVHSWFCYGPDVMLLNSSTELGLNWYLLHILSRWSLMLPSHFELTEPVMWRKTFLNLSLSGI